MINQKVVGKCPICDRDLIEGPSIDKHHFFPKCKGGKETEFVHKVCHSKIHSLFTEKELEKYYYTAERIKENEDMKKFIIWVSKKEPTFKSKNKKSNKKKR